MGADCKYVTAGAHACVSWHVMDADCWRSCMCGLSVMQQYWNSSQAYKYMPVPAIAEAFKGFRVGQETAARLAQAPDKAAVDKQAEGVELLVKKKYALSPGQLFAACWQVSTLWHELSQS